MWVNTNAKFKRKIDEVYPDQFDTTDSYYIDCISNLHIRCKICDTKIITTSKLIFDTTRRKNPCAVCNKNKMIKNFIDGLKEAKGEKYIVTNKFEYTNLMDLVEIHCVECNKNFLARPRDLLNKRIRRNCRFCRIKDLHR